MKYHHLFSLLNKSSKFITQENCLFFITSDGIIECGTISDGKMLTKWAISTHEPHIVFKSFKNNELILTNLDNKSFFIDSVNGILERTLDIGIHLSFDDFFIKGKRINGKFHGCLINKADLIEKWSIHPYPFFQVLGEKYLLGFPKYDDSGIRDGTVFSRYNLDNGEPVWNLEVDVIGQYKDPFIPSSPWLPGKVEKFIGIWQDKLYVAITNHTILEVEMQSGEVLRMWRELPEIYKTTKLNHLPSTSKFQLYSHEGKLKAVYIHVFIEIDLVSGAITVHNYTELFQTLEFTFQSRPDFVIDDRYILNGGQARDPISGEYSNEIVLFNHQTLEIEWRHIFPPQCGHILKIEQVGNFLYCLDQKGTLHIFERTDAVNS